MDALENLTEALRAHLAAHPDNPLPSARESVRIWRVSPRTWSAAVARLVAEGLVVARRGDAVRPRAADPPVPSPRANWRDQAERLRRELADGLHPSDRPLPSPQEWAETWGLHPATVRKALASLVAAGSLRREGRRWYPAVPRPRRRAARLVVACVVQADLQGRPILDSEREIEVWREIQTEAARHGLALRSVPWNGNLPPSRGDEIGYAVSTWHVRNPHALLAAVAARRRNASIWLENALELPGPRWARAPRLRFHDTGYAREAGRTVGEHLAQLGHHRLAWLSPFQGSRWSRNRLEGLREGFRGEIETFTLAGLSEWDRLTPLWEDEIRHPATAPVAEREWPLRPLELVRPRLEARARDLLMADFAPCLRAALACGASAWVGASDLCAVLARMWLERNAPGAATRLALCGFDDSPLALRHDLTSYRFDAISLARAMVHHLLEGPSGPGRLVRHPGLLVVRGSSTVLLPSP